MEKRPSSPMGKLFRVLFFIFLVLSVVSVYVYGSVPPILQATRFLLYLPLFFMGAAFFSLIFWILLLGSKIIRSILIGILTIILFAVLTYAFIASPIKVTGTSMEPTFMNKQMAMLNKIVYKFADPQRGDIVTYKFQKADYIGRVIGLPGEEIVINKGSVLVNGGKINEPYASWQKYDVKGGTVIRLKGDEYLVLNDNRNSLMNVIKKKDFNGRVFSL